MNNEIISDREEEFCTSIGAEVFHLFSQNSSETEKKITLQISAVTLLKGDNFTLSELDISLVKDENQ